MTVETGGIIFPAIFSPIVDSAGFGWAVRTMAFINLACLLVAIAVVKQRAIPEKPRKALDMPAFREVRFNVFNIGSCLIFMGMYTPFYYVTLFSQNELGISQELSNDVLCVLGAGMVVGRPFIGVAATEYGAFVTGAFCILLCGLMQFIWGSVHNLGGVMSFVFFYGFFSGGVSALVPVIAVELAPSISIAGTRLGMNFVFMGLGILVGNPIAGALLQGRSRFEGAEAFSAAVLLAGSVLIVASWELLKRHKKAKESQ